MNVGDIIADTRAKLGYTRGAGMAQYTASAEGEKLADMRGGWGG